MNQKEREPNLIWLVNWIWRDSSVIFGGQQEGNSRSRFTGVNLLLFSRKEKGQKFNEVSENLDSS